MQLQTGLLITPLFGAILIAVSPAGHDRLYRTVALTTAAVTMLLSFYVLSVFDTQVTGLQLTEHMFSMRYMAQAAGSLSEHKQLLIFLGFLIGFSVKMPIFPIHGWLPVAHVEAPSPVCILL